MSDDNTTKTTARIGDPALTKKKITKKITIDKIMKIISLILPLCIPTVDMIAGSPAEFIPPEICEEIEYILESSDS